MNWKFQDAKDGFPKMVELAQTSGPQTITLHGQRVAVVISAEEYDRLIERKPSFVEHLLSGAEWDDEFVEEVNRRPKSMIRDIDL